MAVALFRKKSTEPLGNARAEWGELFAPLLAQIPEQVGAIQARAAATAVRDHAFEFVVREDDGDEGQRLYGLVLALSEACQGRWEYDGAPWNEVLANYAALVKGLRDRGREQAAIPAQDVVLAIAALKPWERAEG